VATHQPPEVRRAQILEAALVCFGQRGLHASKMDDIAAAAGLSKGAIYWHFGSKDEIFVALFDQLEKELLAEWEDIDRGDALAALGEIGALSLSRILETRRLLDAWTEFLRHETSRARMGEIYRGSRERIAAIVRRGVSTGQIRPSEPDLVAGMLVGLVEGLLLQAFADPKYDPLATFAASWEIAARGLAAPS